uniref:Uncharacterized protein n=1 Tax=Romanomermis culicivorax TaxID=13658 RepID=A0A915HH02_ROMCU
MPRWGMQRKEKYTCLDCCQAKKQNILAWIVAMLEKELDTRFLRTWTEHQESTPKNTRGKKLKLILPNLVVCSNSTYSSNKEFSGRFFAQTSPVCCQGLGTQQGARRSR